MIGIPLIEQPIRPHRLRRRGFREPRDSSRCSRPAPPSRQTGPSADMPANVREEGALAPCAVGLAGGGRLLGRGPTGQGRPQAQAEAPPSPSTPIHPQRSDRFSVLWSCAVASQWCCQTNARKVACPPRTDAKRWPRGPRACRLAGLHSQPRSHGPGPQLTDFQDNYGTFCKTEKVTSKFKDKNQRYTCQFLWNLNYCCAPFDDQKLRIGLGAVERRIAAASGIAFHDDSGRGSHITRGCSGRGAS